MDQQELAQVIGFARRRWERYISDHKPIPELDDLGQTLDEAIAARVAIYIRTGS